MKKLQFFSIALLFLWSCASESSKPTSPFTPDKNQAHGRVNQILVIAEDDLWKSPVGDTFFYYFGAPYILLPQPEPIFDVQHLTPEQLSEQTVKKEFRTVLFLADLNNENSSVSSLVKADLGGEKLAEVLQGKKYGVTVGRDKWAKEQLLFYIHGFGEERLVENIQKNFPSIARKINEKDETIVKANAYQAGRNDKLAAEIKSIFNLDLDVPGDFQKAFFNSQTNTMWLRRDVREVNVNILIHKRPYTNKSQLTKEGIKKIRDEVGRIVTSTVTGSYMRINDVDLPLFVENKTINNQYAVQAKGIWDMVNDFKGGPFVSNLMLDEKAGELILVDAFVFAPQKDKRNYMQEMELIISSAKILADVK